MDTLTYSAGTTFCLCEEKYRLKYQERLTAKSKEDGEALTVGSIVHAGLEHWLRSGNVNNGFDEINRLCSELPVIGENLSRKADEIENKCKAMLTVAAERWQISKPIEKTEIIVQSAITNPETNRNSRNFSYTGKVDIVIDSKIIDWKTCADPLRYITTKTIGFQPELYAIAVGENITSIEYRLIKRPTIRLKQKETPEEYLERCIDWLANTDYAIMEHEVFLNPARIEAAKHWLWNLQKRISEARKSNRWMRNEIACHSWNRQCEFLSLCEVSCSGGDPKNIQSEMFDRRDKVHVEL